MFFSSGTSQMALWPYSCLHSSSASRPNYPDAAGSPVMVGQLACFGSFCVRNSCVAIHVLLLKKREVKKRCGNKLTVQLLKIKFWSKQHYLIVRKLHKSAHFKRIRLYICWSIKAGAWSLFGNLCLRHVSLLHEHKCAVFCPLSVCTPQRCS